MQNDKTVWLIGAGFSKPLGGPLFADLISARTERWVLAWASSHMSRPDGLSDLLRCRLIYDKGVRVGLWSNAEECISLLDTAQSIKLSEIALQHGIQENEPDVSPLRQVRDPIDIEKTFTWFTIFVAIATAYYVPGTDKHLSEAWHPFKGWAKSLSSNDTIISFNYDRVVERLETAAKLLKLHGTTPSEAELAEHLNKGTPVASIYVPGPSKLRAPSNPEWTDAGKALQNALRLVVIGYSFPESDAAARAFVLRNFLGKQLAIVVGKGTVGEMIHSTFRHVADSTGVTGVVNTGQFTEAYLTDGTARATDGRFMHSVTWKPSRLG